MLDPEGVIRLLQRVIKTCPNVKKPRNTKQLIYIEKLEYEIFGWVSCDECVVGRYLGGRCVDRMKSGDFVKTP